MIPRLREGGSKVTVLLRKPICGVPDAVALSWADRKTGLLLSSVTFTCALFRLD